MSQILGLFLFAGLFSLAYYENYGYRWLGELLYTNMKTVIDYPELSHSEKLEQKLGSNLKYLNYVIQNTPKDAVILMPPLEKIRENEKSTGFDKNLGNKVWVSYFLYPRKVVMEDNKDSSPLYSKVTHVAVINGWGYHMLPYTFQNKPTFSVIPLK